MITNLLAVWILTTSVGGLTKFAFNSNWLNANSELVHIHYIFVMLTGLKECQIKSIEHSRCECASEKGVGVEQYKWSLFYCNDKVIVLTNTKKDVAICTTKGIIKVMHSKII